MAWEDVAIKDGSRMLFWLWNDHDDRGSLELVAARALDWATITILKDGFSFMVGFVGFQNSEYSSLDNK